MMMGEALQECLSRFPKIETLHAKQIEALVRLLSGRNVAIQVLKAYLHLASHADVFSGARISSLPTNAFKFENNILFPLF